MGGTANLGNGTPIPFNTVDMHNLANFAQRKKKRKKQLLFTISRAGHKLSFAECWILRAVSPFVRLSARTSLFFLLRSNPISLEHCNFRKYWKASDPKVQMGFLASLAFCLTGVLVGQSTAHFLLNFPPTIGFDDSLEATPPCGSFTVDFSKDNVTDFHVGGDFIAMTSIHPMATWLFRATLDQTASGNWSDLLPAVVQTGLGDYCETGIMVPSTWAGSKGVVGVVQDAPDGILYQVSLLISQFRSLLIDTEC